MKAQRIRVSEDKREDLLEEYHMLGYWAEIVGDEIIVYLSKTNKPAKKQAGGKAERWSKRERNFGYTRG